MEEALVKEEPLEGGQDGGDLWLLRSAAEEEVKTEMECKEEEEEKIEEDKEEDEEMEEDKEQEDKMEDDEDEEDNENKGTKNILLQKKALFAALKNLLQLPFPHENIICTYCTFPHHIATKFIFQS